MTMAASKWQQPQKQGPHQRWKQWPSGGGENFGTTMTAMTGNKDYDAGDSRHCVVVDNGNRYNDNDHNNDGGCC